MKFKIPASVLSFFLFAIAFNTSVVVAEVYLGNGIKIGEVTQHTAIIWTRITSRQDLDFEGAEWGLQTRPRRGEQLPEGKTLVDMEAAMPGAAGSVQLTYWPAADAEQKTVVAWQPARQDADFTRQFHLKNLSAGTRYQLLVESRTPTGAAGASLIGSFATAPAAEETAPVSFTVVTGSDYPRRDDGVKGHKIYPLMQKLKPDFFVHTGDIEYYDKPRPLATNVALARFKWNRLFALPHQREFHSTTASYFIKDDHDTLKNDCWPGQIYGDLTWKQGLSLFKEQFPVGELPYRTIRWGKDLQVWLVEGRDFRSANNAADGPGKTIWGKMQKQWFFKSVAASDATFKILISPTPLVGPDRVNKGDNHANKNFAYEGKQLREFIGKQKNMFVCCGDRHWQYVSVEPVSGVREYSCGPTSNKHASGWSNDKRSPMHRYLNVTGGFLNVSIQRKAGKPIATFRHYGTNGKLLNEDQQPFED